MNFTKDIPVQGAKHMRQEYKEHQMVTQVVCHPHQSSLECWCHEEQYPSQNFKLYFSSDISGKEVQTIVQRCPHKYRPCPTISKFWQ